ASRGVRTRKREVRSPAPPNKVDGFRCKRGSPLTRGVGQAHRPSIARTEPGEQLEQSPDVAFIVGQSQRRAYRADFSAGALLKARTRDLAAAPRQAGFQLRGLHAECGLSRARIAEATAAHRDAGVARRAFDS